MVRNVPRTHTVFIGKQVTDCWACTGIPTCHKNGLEQVRGVAAGTIKMHWSAVDEHACRSDHRGMDLGVRRDHTAATCGK